MFNYGFPKDWSTIKKLIWLKRFVAASPSWVWQLLTGTAPLTLLDAVAHPIHSLTQFGLCVQDGTPTPDAPVDIVTNNGAIKLRRPSGMPIGYQMVEWLKSTGAVVITGFKTKSTQEIETVFYRERSGASYLYSSDTATSGTTNTTAYLTSGAGNWRWDGKSYSIGVSTGIKFTSIQNKGGVWLNGTKSGWYSDAGEFVSTNDLRLSSGENTTVRIYSMTIREGETVTLDLVPVQRVTDSAYGFYDKVSGEFYTNAEATFDAGDRIDDPVEIYTDGTSETLTVSGKQVWNETWRVGTWGVSVNKAQRVVANDRIASKDFIDVKPNTTYTLSVDDETYNGGFYIVGAHTLEGEDGITVVQSNSGKSATFTTSATTNFIGFSLRPVYGTSYQSNVILELGSTATAYEPYVAPQTVSVPMLLGVGPDDRDEVELVNGPLTHRIGIYVIKGTDDEGWAETATSSGTFFADCLPVAVGHPAMSLFTRYKGVNSSTAVSGMTNRTAKCGSTSNRQRIFIRDASCADADALKAKLSGFYADGEPCIVAFVLATETTEQGAAHALHTSAGTNVVSVTSNVDPVQLEIEYAKEAS